MAVRQIIGLCAAILAVCAACGGKSGGGDDGGNGDSGGGMTKAEVEAFLAGGTYAEWSAKQPAPIDGVSSHKGITRTYLNDAAAAALRAGTAPLPKGSLVVKEMFDADRVTVVAKALMQKVADGAGGDTWLWYESPSHYGTGVAVCTGCHDDAGVDFVRTTVPP